MKCFTTMRLLVELKKRQGKRRLLEKQKTKIQEALGIQEKTQFLYNHHNHQPSIMKSMSQSYSFMLCHSGQNSNQGEGNQSGVCAHPSDRSSMGTLPDSRPDPEFSSQGSLTEEKLSCCQKQEWMIDRRNQWKLKHCQSRGVADKKRDRSLCINLWQRPPVPETAGLLDPSLMTQQSRTFFRMQEFCLPIILLSAPYISALSHPHARKSHFSDRIRGTSSPHTLSFQ